MLEPPADLTDTEVLEAVRTAWAEEVDRVDHLAVGFGGYHWAASAAGRRVLFVTYDRASPRHTPQSLEAALAGGAALAAAGVEFLHASLPARSGGYTLAVASGLLSAAPWVDGAAPGEPHREAPLLSRLHRAAPPPGLPRWGPLVGADLAERLAELCARSWDGGPLGGPARAAIARALPRIAEWSGDYRRLTATTDPVTWVATHGEPGPHNQLVDGQGRLLLVDLESMKLAPRERDLSGLVPLPRAWWAAYAPGAPDPAMQRMFDLEWRLDEIEQYAAWFSGPHAEGADDRTAWGGLRHELGRPDRPTR